MIQILETDDKYKPLLDLLVPNSNGKSIFSANIVLVSWQDAIRAKDSNWGKAIIDLMVTKEQNDFSISIRPYSRDYFACVLEAGGTGYSWMKVNSGIEFKKVGYVNENDELRNFALGEPIKFENIPCEESKMETNETNWKKKHFRSIEKNYKNSSFYQKYIKFFDN